MYNITEIRNDNYSSFLEKMETQLISDKNVKERIGNLLDVPVDYHLVSEFARQYNFTKGVNKILKQRFENNQMLTPSKIIGDIKYYKIDNRYIMFLITKNKDKQLSTYENIYVTLVNLKQFCEENNISK
jgi:hypothetical protein